jgi:hypothetical protein
VFSQLHARRTQDDADGFGRSPLAADHFPDVAGMDAQLEHDDLFTFDHTDLNLVGVIPRAPSQSSLSAPSWSSSVCAPVQAGSRACACKLNPDSTTQHEATLSNSKLNGFGPYFDKTTPDPS